MPQKHISDHLERVTKKIAYMALGTSKKHLYEIIHVEGVLVAGKNKNASFHSIPQFILFSLKKVSVGPLKNCHHIFI